MLIIRANSAWARGLWAEVWHRAHAYFHEAPFWDQSGLCQALLQRQEFVPEVIGARPTGLRPSEKPWFSWMGGRHRKETPNLGIWDAAHLQFANPLHAHFILHLCGYSEKLELCRSVLRSGRLRGLQSTEARCVEWDVVRCFGGSMEKRKEANEVLRAVLHFSNKLEQSQGGGWQVDENVPFREEVHKSPSLKQALEAHTYPASSRKAVIAPAPVPTGWSLLELRTLCGDVSVPIHDRTSGGRSARVALWQICDYVRGFPPPCHPLLGRLDRLCLWRVRWQQWATSPQGQPFPEPFSRCAQMELPWSDVTSGTSSNSKVDSCNAEIERSSLQEATLHLSPPGAEFGLQQLGKGDVWTAIWQLDGIAECVLWLPYQTCTSATEEMHSSLRAGEVLLVPPGYLFACRALAPSLWLQRPWHAPTPISLTHEESNLPLGQQLPCSLPTFHFASRSQSDDGSLLSGGWTWFGDPANWLGAPPGHMPVDQVGEARRKLAHGSLHGQKDLRTRPQGQVEIALHAEMRVRAAPVRLMVNPHCRPHQRWQMTRRSLLPGGL